MATRCSHPQRGRNWDTHAYTYTSEVHHKNYASSINYSTISGSHSPQQYIGAPRQQLKDWKIAIDRHKRLIYRQNTGIVLQSVPLFRATGTTTRKEPNHDLRINYSAIYDARTSKNKRTKRQSTRFGQALTHIAPFFSMRTLRHHTRKPSTQKTSDLHSWTGQSNQMRTTETTSSTQTMAHMQTRKQANNRQ